MRRLRALITILCIMYTAAGWCISAPDHLIATSGTDVIELTWSDVPTASDYEVYRAVGSPSGFMLIGSPAGNSYRDTSVAMGSVYYYYVRAHAGSSVYGEPSSTVEATPRTTGTIVCQRWSDFIYYFNPWMIHTNGDPADTHTEQELWLTEGDESVVYQSGTSIDFSASTTPRLTPDRTKLIFAVNNSLRLLLLEDYTESIIVPGSVEQELGFDISPDGRWVVYVKKWMIRNAIYLRSVEGGDEQELVKDFNSNRYPSFSPDGQSVVFVSDRQANKDEIYVLNLISTSVTRVTTNNYSEKYPRFSPDVSKIAFQAYNSSADSTDIFTVQANGSNTVNVTSASSANEYFPEWSPDGSKLAFVLRNDVVVGLNDGEPQTEYYFHIQMKNADGSGSSQYLTDSSYEIIRGAISWHGATDVMPPSPVLGLTAGIVSETAVTLDFTAPGDDGSTGQAAGYRVIYDTTSFSGESYEQASVREISITPASAGDLDSCTIDHLLSDTTYYIALVAYDDAGNESQICNVITATTSPSANSAPPAPPSDLDVQPRDFLRMHLTWDHSPSGDTAGYKIYRNSEFIAQTSYLTGYVDTVPQKNVSYTYTVSAIDETDNEGTVSTSDQAVSRDATVPPYPQWIRVYNLADRIRIVWEPVNIPDVAGYKIYRDGSFLDTTDIAQYEDTTAVIDTTYEYRIASYDTAGNESSQSDVYTGTAGWPDNERILVLVNSASVDSQEVGAYYAAARNIPAAHVLELDNLPAAYAVSLTTYLDRIRTPVLNYLESNNLTDKIIYLVTTTDIPVAVGSSCVDAMLADLYTDPPDSVTDYIPDINDVVASPHAYYLSQKRFSPDYNMLVTSRIDGPTVDIAKSIVDQVIYAERYPSVITPNSMVIDNRGLKPDLYNGLYSEAERYIGTAAMVARFNSVPLKHDTQEAMFAEHSIDNAQYFYGWYSFWNFKDLFVQYLEPGSIAGHLGSLGFYRIYNTGDNNWGVHLLERGATIVYGPLVEPYSTTFPVGGILYSRLLRGFTAGEAYWCATNTLRWRMMIVGDPLYNPYAAVPAVDSTAPAISSVSSSPFGFLSYAITWQNDEACEHAVEFFAGAEPVLDTGYQRWMSRNAHIVLTNLEKNVTYSYRVKSKDSFGNESVSGYFQFTYTDSDNDGIDDSWETDYFGNLSATSGFEDADGDNLNDFFEFDQGLDPLTENIFRLEKTDSLAKLSFDVSTGRIYQLYYSDELTGQPSQWIPAGPYRLGMARTLEWTDDGRNTSPNPQDASVTVRTYRITTRPRNR